MKSLIHYIIFLLFLVFAAPVPAGDYIPVDDLRARSAALRKLPARLRYQMQRAARQNPRMRGYIRRPTGLAPRFRPYLGSRVYNPRLLYQLPPRDPNIGKWVSPPPEYLLAEHQASPPKGASVYHAQATDASPQKQPGGRLFNTVEFGRPLNTLPGWLDVLKRNEASPIFQAQKYFNKKTNWESLKNQAAGLSKMDQLRLVNKFWNTFPYREDMANWGKPDYWAIPAEFLRKSGDCEDYAIVKYFTLKELGFDPHKMRLVVLRDTIRNLPHAVLAVYMDGDIYILDNLSAGVLSHKRMGNYSPQYSVNEFGRWAHIKSKGKH